MRVNKGRSLVHLKMVEKQWRLLLLRVVLVAVITVSGLVSRLPSCSRARRLSPIATALPLLLKIAAGAPLPAGRRKAVQRVPPVAPLRLREVTAVVVIVTTVVAARLPGAMRGRCAHALGSHDDRHLEGNREE